MRRHPWLALTAGFGGLLLLMAAAQLGALFMIDNLRDSGTQVQQRFLERSRTLEQIRSSIYLSGTVARDSLLAPAGSASSQLAEVNHLHQQTDEALDKYQKSIEKEEAAAFANLRSEIEAYWRVLDRTFAWSDSERMEYRYQFFYSELIPRRTTMLQIADRVGQLNEQALLRGDQQFSGRFEQLRLGLIGMTVLTLIGGLTLAVNTSVLILRLQNEVHTRLNENIEAKTSLRELSAKLVRAQEEERRALRASCMMKRGNHFQPFCWKRKIFSMNRIGISVRPHLESIRGMAERGLAAARNLALLLRPSMLDDFGLVPALNWQARELAKRTGLRVQVSAAELSAHLPEEHKTCIYRVVQEALNNVAKHAQASTAQVTLMLRDEGVIDLTVQDDGSGFDAARVRGLGLLGMEERVHHLGGAFTIDSQPGLGTRLKVNLPLADLATSGMHDTNTDFAGRRS